MTSEPVAVQKYAKRIVEFPLSDWTWHHAKVVESDQAESRQVLDALPPRVSRLSAAEPTLKDGALGPRASTRT